MTHYKLTLSEKWMSTLNKEELAKGGTRMITDILNRAKTNAPYKSGALRNSGRFMQLSTLKWVIQFGNGRVDYAEIREKVNHLHPNTVRYLGRAVDSAKARTKSYFNLGG